MDTLIGRNLLLKRLPRSKDLGDYDWFDIEESCDQVGKARCRIEGSAITICSINIYPEYQRKGYARAVIDHFKHKYLRIVADRVRYTARDFWMEMGFSEENVGDFTWHR
ncbi:MAG: GNAT family N-acetyltransferase [Spirochaetota bacterium]